MVDDMFDFLETVNDRPVWRKPPSSALEAIREPLPRGSTPPEQVYAQFREHILPYAKGNISPRFFSWVEGNGTFMGMMADMLASGMNPNVTIGDHMAMYVDQQVIDWCRQMMGFPESASGMLVSGGSLANITAMTVARNHMLPQARAKGLQAGDRIPVIYCSSETHNCMNKAVEVLGMGGEQLRIIPVDSDYRMDIAALERQLEADKQAGYHPICIVGNAGTVNTGAIDPLDDLLRIARREALWFHVDGAFGAAAGITEHGAHTLAAMREADSLAFDLHKWFYVNYEVGCVLIRDREIHRKAFVMEAAYLTKHERGLPSGPETYSHYGLELSRGFKALKVWMSLKEHGLDRYREIVTRNIDQARYLANLVQQHPKLELLAPVSLNIVCFRYLFDGDHNAMAKTEAVQQEPLSLERLNELNRELLMRLHESGEAVPSYTVLQGRYGIRVNNTNHRTRYEDLDRMILAILRLAESVSPNPQSLFFP